MSILLSKGTRQYYYNLHDSIELTVYYTIYFRTYIMCKMVNNTDI